MPNRKANEVIRKLNEEKRKNNEAIKEANSQIQRAQANKLELQNENTQIDAVIADLRDDQV